MSKKTIVINPAFMAVSGNGGGGGGASTLKRRPKKEKPQMAVIQPTQLRKQLLTKIKDYQNKVERAETKKTNGNNLAEDEKEFNDDFNKTLGFLEILSNNKKKEERIDTKQPISDTIHNKQVHNKHMRTTLKKPHTGIHIATELPPELSLDYNTANTSNTSNIANTANTANQVSDITHNVFSAPLIVLDKVSSNENIPEHSTPQICFPDNSIVPYGNLKNGTKPTFRQWSNKTIKNRNSGNSISMPGIKPGIRIMEEKDILPLPNIPISSLTSPRQDTLEKIKEEYRAEKAASRPAAKPIIIDTDTSIENISLPPPQIKRTRISKTLKHNLGKHGNKVAVLIKNMKTRKLVQHEYALLKQKGILEIKNHLREKNLMKADSNAPADVLRQMYEQSILTGDVDNRSKDVLIHNYMSKM
jgi:hypothetical protein